MISKALRYDPCVTRGHTVLPATHTRTIPAFTLQPQGIIALWLVPTYTDWWTEAHRCEKLAQFLRRVPGRESNPRPLDRKSDTLLTAPRHHPWLAVSHGGLCINTSRPLQCHVDVSWVQVHCLQPVCCVPLLTMCLTLTVTITLTLTINWCHEQVIARASVISRVLLYCGCQPTLELSWLPAEKCSDHTAALPDNNDASNILPLQMAECLLRAQPDSVSNHITARLISINISDTLTNMPICP